MGCTPAHHYHDHLHRPQHPVQAKCVGTDCSNGHHDGSEEEGRPFAVYDQVCTLDLEDGDRRRVGLGVGGKEGGEERGEKRTKVERLKDTLGSVGSSFLQIS